ncbi:uncharacterized protein LOC130986744 [Salvia miltiorrhiza]|uniref:uncharacterized protein LOC130986744 n=1 Tax=Salvia miltiorrhiza TaxID=226208 RepID=UPI0025ACFD7E|nr:uncharacterized protein LOC130986744 [Salvia miltiorrhiza]
MSSNSGLWSSSPRGSRQMENEYDVKYCNCGFGSKRLKATRMTSWTEENPGRRFYGCRNWKTKNCGFFDWYDEPMSERAMEVINHLKKENMKLVKMNENSTPPTDFEAEIGDLWTEIQACKEESRVDRRKNRFLVIVLIISWFVMMKLLIAGM